MATVSALLTQTMLGTAAPNPQWDYVWAPLPITEPLAQTGTEEESIIQNNPIWHFESPTFTGHGIRVSNVSCKVRSMNYMKMPVLSHIEWGPVVIRSDDLGGEVSLSLTQEFLVCSRYVREGSISGSNSGYWQLPAKVDQSFEMVFGYELLSLADSPAPLRVSQPTPLTAENVDPNDFDVEAAVTPMDPGSGFVVTLRTRPMRVIVVVSLVCCKERNDFVPSAYLPIAGEVNPLGLGRIYPLLMMVASRSLDSVTGSVTLTRPRTTMHTEMGGERMSSNISSAFFTDRNVEPGLDKRPLWSSIFDYYWIDPPAGTYMMAKPAHRSSEETIRNAVTVHERDFWGTEESSERSVRKTLGQGEFDSIHLAPKMEVSQNVLELNPDLTGLNAITMAPFCIHDCFHMHWRWSSGFPGKQSKGWIGQLAFADSGAPLVPGNQEVKIELLSGVSFRYIAEAEHPTAGEWQIMLHHGGAYALSVNALGEAAKAAVLTVPALNQVFIKGGGGTWATFYWWLRFERSAWKGRQFERLTWTPEQFARLRGILPV